MLRELSSSQLLGTTMRASNCHYSCTTPWERLEKQWRCHYINSLKRKFDQGPAPGNG